MNDRPHEDVNVIDRPQTPSPAGSKIKTLNLALQGGGAHGAFTWGVLDTLLEAPRLEFEGLSGSSAGAINAAVLADGWVKGGREGAREALAAFWTELAQLLPAGLVAQGDGDTTRLSPAARWMASWAALFTPAQLNPLGVNPLRKLLARRIDFEGLRAHSPFKLFIGATQANSGKLRIFREHELTVDMLLASACLPKMHHPIDIEGEPYWDGGYSANPAVFPLFYECACEDVLLVLLSPLERDYAPRTAAEIDQRIAELSFNATFMREMQTFARAVQFADHASAVSGSLERKLQSLRFHMIDTSELAALQRTETKALAHRPFLEFLRAQGRERADAWLAKDSAQIGNRSTVDLGKWFG
jgi:NTE family protein